MSNTYSIVAKGTQQENEAVARRFHMEIFKEGKLEVADEILSSDFVLRNPTLPSEFTHGPDGVKKFASLVVDSSYGYQIIHHQSVVWGETSSAAAGLAETQVKVSCIHLGFHYTIH